MELNSAASLLVAIIATRRLVILFLYPKASIFRKHEQSVACEVSRDDATSWRRGDEMRRSSSKATLVLAVVSAGCGTFHGPIAAAPELPRELEKVTHAEYIIEPPDELLLDAIRVI